MKIFSRQVHLLLFAILFTAVSPNWALAQSPLEAAAGIETPAEPAQETLKDPLGRNTPAGTINGFLDSVTNEDYDRAGLFMDLKTLPKAMRKTTAAELARNLQYLLDQNGYLRTKTMSDLPEGKLDDNLAADLESIGAVKAGDESIPLLAQRIDDNGVQIWLVSSDTVSKIPTLMKEVTKSRLNRMLPDQLVEKKWLGIPVGHWLTLLLLIPVSYGISYLIVSILLLIACRIRHLWHEEKSSALLSAFVQPVRLFLAVWIYVVVAIALGVSLVARKYFGIVAESIALVSIAWLVWRILEVFTNASRERFRLRGQIDAISILTFFRRSAKFAIIVLSAMAILNIFGVDVTAGLAALGIGGIAIAFGAQKTVENFIGSLSVIADRPIRIGDFCKFDDISGTVEDIGMRSTRVRTSARTVVTIPNGEFSSLKIENFARRDRFLFNPILNMRYETTTDQIRYLLVQLRSMLIAHPKMYENPRVRFIRLATNSLDIEIYGYINTADYDEYTEIQEDLLLRIMEIVEESGSQFAFPSQTIYMARDTSINEEAKNQAEQQVHKWEETGTLQIPKFDKERIDQLRGTIKYPPEGSAANKPND